MLKTVNLSTTQAKEIAHFIYKDIAEYIKEHQEEYKAFLLEQEREVAA